MRRLKAFLAIIVYSLISLSIVFLTRSAASVESSNPLSPPADHLTLEGMQVANSTPAPADRMLEDENSAGEPQPLTLQIAGPGGDCETPYRDLSWLEMVNRLRGMAHLPRLSENSAWSYGACLHSRYEVKNDHLGHSEDPANPWYTAEGNAAAGASNVLASWNINKPEDEAVIRWATGPYHLIGIIRPGLTTTGFGSYREDIGKIHYAATLDVIRGLGGLPDGVRYPVYFPAAGEHFFLRQYGGGESPDPMLRCPGYQTPTGAPFVLQLSGTPSLSSHQVILNGAPIEACGFTTGNAVVIMPRNPLTSGIYRVVIEASGSRYDWSFFYGRAGCTPPPLGYCGGASTMGSLDVDKAYDDNRETYFQGNEHESAWDIYYNFGSPVQIGSLEIDYVSSSSIAAVTRLKVSSDGSTWQTIGTFPVADPAVLPVNGAYQYYQLEMSGLSPQQRAPAIREVSVRLASAPPSWVAPPSASPDPVSGQSAELRVLASDDGGESSLSYTWEVVQGPAAVSFSPNASNAAKNTQAGFQRAGSYLLRVVARDRDGLMVSAELGLQVRQTATALTITPQTAEVAVGEVRSFQARLVDQFGEPVARVKTFSWQVSGGGSVQSGEFTASRVGGPYTLTAEAEGISGSALVSVIPGVGCLTPVPADAWQAEFWPYAGGRPPEPAAPAAPPAWGGLHLRENAASRYQQGAELDLNFERYQGGPNRCGVGSDRFLGLLSRQAYFAAGSYEFTAGSDDGIKVWVGDQPLPGCSFWNDRSYREQNCRIELQQSGTQRIMVAYYENGGAARLSFGWRLVQAATATQTARPTATQPPATHTPRPTATNPPATHTPRPTATNPPATHTPRPTATNLPATHTPRPTATNPPAPTAVLPSPTPSGTMRLVTTTIADIYTNFGHSSSYTQHAQSFRAPGERICRLTLALARYGSPGQEIQLMLRASLAGADLARERILAAEVISQDYRNPSWIEVRLPGCLQVTPGNTYYLVLSTEASSRYHYFQVPLNRSNPYPDGEFFRGRAADRLTTMDLLLQVTFGEGTGANTAPAIPQISYGPSAGSSGEVLTFTASSTDPEGQRLRLTIDWGDGARTQGPLIRSGEQAAFSHAWSAPGSYSIRLQASDEFGAVSPWSAGWRIEINAAQEELLIIADAYTSSWHLGKTQNQDRLAQSFRSTSSAIEGLWIAMQKVGQPVAPLRISLRSALHGGILGSLEIDPASIPAGAEPTWVHAVFSPAVKVSPSSTTYLVLETQTGDADNYFMVGFDERNPYRPGYAYQGSALRRDSDMTVRLILASR